MRILLTNDDGMHASGLIPLIRACRKYGEVTAVVPQREQSGMSHAIEIHKAFEVREEELAGDVRILAVNSSPSDCVRFAILGMKQKFDLVVSGINRGFNIGTDIQYSGTVGAALEGVHLGTRAIALSTCPEYYDKAIDYVDTAFEYIFENSLFEHGPIYNVNIPERPHGIVITRQGGAYYSDEFRHIGNDMYMPCGVCVYRDMGDMSLDTDAVMHGYMSITPLASTMTDLELYRKLKEQN